MDIMRKHTNKAPTDCNEIYMAIVKEVTDGTIKHPTCVCNVCSNGYFSKENENANSSTIT